MTFVGENHIFDENNNNYNDICSREPLLFSYDENINKDNNKELIGDWKTDSVEKFKYLNDITSLSDVNKNYSTETTKKSLGRKRKNESEKGNHNKYAPDNLIKKIKNKILSCISEFINDLIRKVYNDNIRNGILLKQLLPIDQKKFQDVDYLKNFLNKTLKDIFYTDISKRYTNYLKEHNIKLINNLLNEKNEKISELFNNIFNLTFVDCLKHISGTKTIKELKGLKSLNEICISMSKEDQEYKDLFQYTTINLEALLMNKRSRSKKC
jgi:hypothetical protein